MNQDPLSRFAAALADENDGAVPAPSVTRERILATLGPGSPKRRLRLAWHAPVWLAFVGSTAWATQHVPLRRWLAEQVAPNVAPRQSESSAPAAVEPAPAPLEASASEPTQRSVALEAAQPQKRATAQPAEAAHATRANGTATATPGPEEAFAPEPITVPSVGASALPEAALPDALSLYRSAHDAQFKRSSYATALDGYQRYLAEFPSGEFAPEARYNSAICLLNIGRTSEARALLEEFAAGAYGDYRRTRARELLDALVSD